MAQGKTQTVLITGQLVRSDERWKVVGGAASARKQVDSRRGKICKWYRSKRRKVVVSTGKGC